MTYYSHKKKKKGGKITVKVYINWENNKKICADKKSDYK